MNLIETQNLRKSFGPIQAVQGVSFRVSQGEVLGFLGPNGAGKSTVMRMLTGFLSPSGGSARIGGHDIVDDSIAARRMVGYLPESNPLYAEMTAEGFLLFIGQIHGLRGVALQGALDEVLEKCGIREVRHQILETLSKGYKRRVGLAQALIHDPKILILDEPTDGLDPNQKHEVRTLIRQMAADKAIVISTHILEEVDAVCTRAIIISEGRIVADGTPTELRHRSHVHGTVRLSVRAGGAEISDVALTAIKNVKQVERQDTADGIIQWTIFPEKDQNVVHEVALVAQSEKWQVEELRFENGNLTEVFREITKRGHLAGSVEENN